MRRISFLVMPAALFLAGSIAMGSNWPQWRGPDFNGSSPARNLPTTWTREENVKWVTPLPGQGGATPIIWDDRIFVTAHTKTKELAAICIDRSTGNVIWEKKLGVTLESDEGRGMNMASPSPAVDGEKVIFSFGTGDIAALDFDGNVIWKRNHQRDHGKFQYNFGYHASPLLYDGKLYIQVLQRDRNNPGSSRKPSHPESSYILCLNPETGEDLWKHDRPTEAHDESRESYATPIPYKHNGREEILIAGGDLITGHDPETGKEYWRWGSWNPARVGHWRIVPSPVFYEDLVYMCAPKQEPVFAIKAGGVGHLSDDWVKWELTEHTTDVAVPLIYKDRMYVLDGDNKWVTSLNPKTGEEYWKGRLSGKAVYRASLTGADDKIYCINEQGIAEVLGTGDEFEILHKTNMDEPLCRSSISVTDGALFIRTGENLYCIGE